MNQLSQFLRENRITQTSFAARIGITQAALSRMLSGQIEPSLKTAALIETETGGRVLAVSWVAPAPEQKEPEEDAA